jgi:hypothetical protein
MFKLRFPGKQKDTLKIQGILKALIITMLYCAEYFIANCIIYKRTAKVWIFPEIQVIPCK